MRFGISNLILPALSRPARDAALAASRICDFAPTVHYGTWEHVPAEMPERPYGAQGPRVSALQSLFFGVPGASLVGDQEAFSTLERHFVRLTGWAARAGIPFLVFGSPATRRGFAEDGRVEVRRRIASLADIARAARVKLCFEVNSTSFGCEFLTHNAELRGLLADLAHPGLGLHLDTGQMLEEGVDVVSYVARSAPELVHLHLSAPDFTCRPELLGMYRQVLSELGRRNPEVDVVLEVQKLGGAVESEFLGLCSALSAECAP